MKRENLFRLALVTHSHAPETLNKYIALLAKMVIIESSELSFKPSNISMLIKDKFGLEFIEEEIYGALNLDEDFDINLKEKVYSLKAGAIQKIKDSEENCKTIEYYLKEFIGVFYINAKPKEKRRIIELVMKYIYYSFNSGKKSLTSLLIGNSQESIMEDFSINDNDKKIINQFLEWDNPEKNECIYSIVSYCLDYGMLTSKKDFEYYKKLFEGVQFYLDANIIFRLIGMNNIERQEVIQHFINKCNEVEIKLCYTNFSYQEIFHAINNSVKFIKFLNNGDKPISPSELDKLGEYDNKDFYEIYYNWCKEKENSYDDYIAFIEYLKEKVNTCLDNFIKVEVNNAEFSEIKQEFLTFSNELMEYKNQRNSQRPCTIESAKIDVNNFLHVRYENEKSNKEMTPVKSFLISADHRFYNWVTKVLPGVPIVFMPSEWLSIILKYTSRTNSDYSTFCKFMNLRLTQDPKQKQRTKQIIESINELTSDVDVKKKIINHISEITLSLPEEYIDNEEKIVKKAFDLVIEEQKYDSEKQINMKLSEQESDFNKKLEDFRAQSASEIEKAKLNTKQETAKTIVDGIVDNKIKKWVWMNKNLKILDSAIGVVAFLVLILLSKIGHIEDAIITFCDSSKLLKGGQTDFSMWFSAAITALIVIGIAIFVKYMSSDNRKQKLVKKEELNIKKL